MGHPATPLSTHSNTSVPHTPQPGIPFGSRIAYRDQHHRLEDGLLQSWKWMNYTWHAVLSNGTTLEADRIVSVGYLNNKGETIGAELWPPRTSGPQMSTGAPQTHQLWLKRFERIRDLTATLPPEDPRFPIIIGLIDQCDAHYQRRDEHAFITTGKRIAALMNP